LTLLRTFRFPELLRSPDRRCPSLLQVVNLLSLAQLSQLSLCPGLLTKARTPRPNSLPCSRREHYSISCGLSARGYTKKIFAGIINPTKCIKPLILLGLLNAYMHDAENDDKKILIFFCAAAKNRAALLFSCLSCSLWLKTSKHEHDELPSCISCSLWPKPQKKASPKNTKPKR